jgi:hypothetical protein
MREPKRLLADGATEFERRLLGAVMNERPTPALRSRMRRGLGLVGPLMWVSNVKAMFADVASKGTAAKVALGVAATGVVAAGGLAVAVGLSSLDEPRNPPAEIESIAATSTQAASAPAGSAQAGLAQAGLAQAVAAPEVAVAPAQAKPPESASRPAPVALDPEASAGVEAVPLLALPEVAQPAAHLAQPTPPAALQAAPTPSEAEDADGTASQLREEIALLDSVRNALQTGARGRAHAALEQYRTRFPSGLLSREAALLRRQAGAKRGSEGRLRLQQPGAERLGQSQGTGAADPTR